jgi:hypothetical protein
VAQCWSKELRCKVLPQPTGVSGVAPKYWVSKYWRQRTGLPYFARIYWVPALLGLFSDGRASAAALPWTGRAGRGGGGVCTVNTWAQSPQPTVEFCPEHFMPLPPSMLSSASSPSSPAKGALRASAYQLNTVLYVYCWSPQQLEGLNQVIASKLTISSTLHPPMCTGTCKINCSEAIAFPHLSPPLWMATYCCSMATPPSSQCLGPRPAPLPTVIIFFTLPHREHGLPLG